MAVISSGNKATFLKFDNINRTDAGQYTCRANNSVEVTSIDTTIVVYCKYILTLIFYFWIYFIYSVNPVIGASYPKFSHQVIASVGLFLTQKMACLKPFASHCYNPKSLCLPSAQGYLIFLSYPMPKVFVRRDILFDSENPFYISLFVGLATLYWILDCQITQKWRTVLWSDHNLHSFFSSKDRERKDKCCARVIDVHDFLVWEVM